MSAARLLAAGLVAGFGLAAAAPAVAEDVLTIYTSRHYDTDERLYTDFEAQTGITVVRVEGKADELIARLQAEGEASPADLLITVDAGRIWRADQAGLLASVDSDVLARRIPAHLRHPEGKWFGFSQRARIIFYDKTVVTEPPLTYEALADPKYKGLVCTRSSSNIYMLSLMASIIAHSNEDTAASWAKGVWDNRARDPEGGDTDQLRGLVSGECAIVVSNTYYFARALRRDVKGVSDSLDRIGWIFPNQSDRGTHVNISAAAVSVNAPNPEAALLFLEYLASDEAQQYFSSGNDEYPAVAGVGLSESVAKLGLFRADDLSLAKLGENQPTAQAIYDEVDYE